MPQRWRAFGMMIRKHIDAVLVEQADMNMRAAAGHIGIRFRHECRFHAVPDGNGTDQALEADGFIAGGQSIVGMLQVDLELAGPVFGERGAGGNLL